MVWTTGKKLQGGKYVIQEVLGQGGFGITYKALHVPFDHFVALKTPNEYLRHDPDYDRYVDRFIREGRMLARLSRNSNPHLVRFRGLFIEAETHCLVMDFIEGENLFQRVQRVGALAEEEAVKYMRQIGEVLTLVHHAKLVHRDAHPGNIILRDNGNAVLIDFGIAKELVPSTQSSAGTGGNRGFAPYEQMLKGSRQPNVDVYCLAATLYFAVTGERPVTSLDRKISNTALIPPQRFNSRISNRLNRAILSGMELEPKNRPQSMPAWLKLLKLPPIIVPPPPKPKSSRPTRKIPWGALIVVLVLYGLLGCLLAAFSSPFWAVAWAGAVTVAWAGAFAGVEVVALAVALAVIVAWVGALAGSMVAAWAGVGAVAVAVAWAGAGTGVAGAGETLLQSFNRFHTFLILVATSWLGLGLGRLVGLILRTN